MGVGDGGDACPPVILCHPAGLATLASCVTYPPAVFLRKEVVFPSGVLLSHLISKYSLGTCITSLETKKETGLFPVQRGEPGTNV